MAIHLKLQVIRTNYISFGSSSSCTSGAVSNKTTERFVCNWVLAASFKPIAEGKNSALKNI